MKYLVGHDINYWSSLQVQRFKTSFIDRKCSFHVCGDGNQWTSSTGFCQTSKAECSASHGDNGETWSWTMGRLIVENRKFTQGYVTSNSCKRHKVCEQLKFVMLTNTLLICNHVPLCSSILEQTPMWIPTKTFPPSKSNDVNTTRNSTKSLKPPNRQRSKRNKLISALASLQARFVEYTAERYEFKAFQKQIIWEICR